MLVFNSYFTSFILFAVISILELFRCIATYAFSTKLYNRATIGAALITHSCIASSLWVKVIFAIGNHKNIQTRDCCPFLFLTGTLDQYHIILLLQIHFINVLLQ